MLCVIFVESHQSLPPFGQHLPPGPVQTLQATKIAHEETLNLTGSSNELRLMVKLCNKATVKKMNSALSSVTLISAGDKYFLALHIKPVWIVLPIVFFDLPSMYQCAHIFLYKCR